ncbi:hypothetical protein BpHYR1_042586 [Brachionus plicatilis]|uniref:Uncharacterized protein n=1 Tax=Brachionus plicatilis TaxID=10195 RepID=A0A3M7R9H9_BRAPC|nr:hypothetical protein BpHYR1_042586 [Brachionus plicatilis]
MPQFTGHKNGFVCRKFFFKKYQCTMRVLTFTMPQFLNFFFKILISKNIIFCLKRLVIKMDLFVRNFLSKILTNGPLIYNIPEFV